MEFQSKRCLRILILIFSVFNLSFGQEKSEFNYLRVDKEWKYQSSGSTNFDISIYKDVSKYFENISNSNTEKITEVLQNLIYKYKKVKLPNRELIVSKEGINLPSNSSIYFDKESVLRIESNDKEQYVLLNINSVKNVSVFNPRLIGDRTSHFGATGEWGHGISINGSESIYIENFCIKNFWGDGIYIGRNEKLKFSKNIKIVGGVSDNNRRNGISITSADGVIISNVISSNTNGTKPMYGICIEANSKDDEINNILLNDIKSFNNEEGGLMISLSKLAGRGNMVIKEVNIEVNNFEDRFSKVSGLFIAQVSSNFKAIEGGIKLTNVIVEGNKRPIIIKNNLKERFKIVIDGYNIVRPLNPNFNNDELKRIHSGKRSISVNPKIK